MKTSKVIISQDATVLQGDTIDHAVVNRMIAQGITKLLGTADAASAWKMLFHPNEIVVSR